MATNNFAIEHFCTLFDKNYLPQGLALHDSLMTHAGAFHLWVVCMDDAVESQLIRLNLPNISLIPLQDVETAELLLVKSSRSRGEYCWTLTPFTFQSVFDKDPDVKQVTYLDADLFFFDNPKILLNELGIQKHVLITDHAYAPEYDQSKISGRFCVQFLTIKRTSEGIKVMEWWQARCLEWCFDRVEGDKFGDQKYLDRWPQIFGSQIHIVQQKEKTLAPWNISYFSHILGHSLNPVFYHFHGFKLTKPCKARLYHKYKISQQGQRLYDKYLNSIAAGIHSMNDAGISVPYTPENTQLFQWIKRTKWILLQETKFRTIPTY